MGQQWDFQIRGANDGSTLTTLDIRFFYHILQQWPINEDTKCKFLNLGSNIKKTYNEHFFLHTFSRKEKII